LYGILAFFVFGKLFLAVAAVFFASWIPQTLFERYEHSLSRIAKVAKRKESPRSWFKGVLKDLSSPLFLISLLFTSVFLYASVRSPSDALLSFCQVLASAILAFTLMRSPYFLNLEKVLKARG
jgi:uncharacterized BrkB/YihY/UPF0761 family membrane protein